MFRYIFIFILTLGNYLSVSGQHVTIKGKVDSSYLSQTNHIYAYTYDDYISFREKELAKSALDAAGNFNLTFPVPHTTQLFLMVDNAKSEMVVEPGKEYIISFLPKDSDAVNTLSGTNPVEIEFLNSDKTELNYLIADFNWRYETMLQDYQGNITRKEPAIFKKIDTLESLFKKKFAFYNNAYLNNYIYYTFASFEDNVTLENKESVYRKHLDGRTIQQDNHSYMTFFNQFYAVSVAYFMNDQKMLAAVNNMQSFSSVLDVYKRSALLANDTIREMVALKSLGEYFRYPEYKTSAVLAVLSQAAEQCKTSGNRKAAENLKKKLSVMNAGKPVPSLAFRELGGNGISLPDLKGKYLYVSFWTTWCMACTQDMTLIPELKKAYGSKVLFVNISLDKKEETIRNFLKKNPKFSPEKNGGGWIFMHADNYKKIKEEFNVLTVPAYFLIDPKGNVVKAPAPGPADIEPEFMKIKQRR